MKSRVPAKASKASLVARGLASKSKPPAFKRGQKGQQKPPKESKPGYSLYTSDSEDQASAVDRGLNRCAALLSNILDHEDKGKAHSRVTSVGRPAKSSIKRVQASQTSVQPEKHDTQKTKAVHRRVVIPTARPDDTASPSPSKPHEEAKGAPTVYNDRLVSSTPVLTAEERQKRQQLQRREAKLQQELTQLKERYELLQKQQSPSHQTEQKLQLQNSMMQELDNHQEKENSFKRHTSLQHSAERQPVVSSGSEKLSSSNPKRSSARRSLDYSGFHVGKDAESDLRNGTGDSQSGTDFVKGGQGHVDDTAKQDMDHSVTQEVGAAETKKRVRIVSPVTTTSPCVDEESLSSSSHRENLSNSPNGHVAISEGSETRQTTPPTSSLGRPTSSSARTSDRMTPSSAENHSRMIQYLVDELRGLLGSTDDLEVDRLLNEIDDAAKLLPYLMEKDKMASVSQDIEQAVQPYKVENAQLRRKLLVAHQKLKEGSLKKSDDKSSIKTDLAFELAACRSVNTVLQKQLTEEKNSREEILRHRDQLSVNLTELQEERKKFLQIFSNKEQDYLRSKREWQQDTSKLTTENRKLKADLEAIHLSTEAEKKEINILTLSLKQKDAEIDRLKELTRGLQQSLTRLLSDIQEFEPKDLIKPGFLDKGIALGGLDKLLGGGVRTIGQSTASRLSSADMPLSVRNNGKSTSPITLLTNESPSALGRSEEVITRRTPSQRSVAQSKKHLRFADGPFSHSEPVYSLTSGLSEPLVKKIAGSGYGTADLHERSAHAENTELPEVELEDLEEEQNGGELSPLSSGEEEDFRRGLENLDANIARIQKSLRETALRT